MKATNSNNEVSKVETDVIKMMLDKRNAEQPAEIKKDIPTVFKSKDFFLDHNPHGLMRISTFQQLVEIWEESDLQEFRVVLQRLNENEKIIYRPVAEGKGPVKKIYLNLYGWRGTERLSIPAVDGVMMFLTFYRQQRFTTEFSLKELLTIAKLI